MTTIKQDSYPKQKTRENQTLPVYQRKMKVLNGLHFTRIWVTKATKWHHTPLYLPSGIVLKILRRDLGLDLVVLTMAKFKKLSDNGAALVAQSWTVSLLKTPKSQLKKDIQLQKGISVQVQDDIGRNYG